MMPCYRIKALNAVAYHLTRLAWPDRAVSWAVCRQILVEQTRCPRSQGLQADPSLNSYRVPGNRKILLRNMHDGEGTTRSLGLSQG